jgi:hypothetical protein
MLHRPAPKQNAPKGVTIPGLKRDDEPVDPTKAAKLAEPDAPSPPEK